MLQPHTYNMVQDAYMGQNQSQQVVGQFQVHWIAPSGQRIILQTQRDRLKSWITCLGGDNKSLQMQQEHA